MNLREKTPEVSFIIVDIITGEAVAELYIEEKTIQKLRPRYKAMRPSEYLPTLNK
jgi:hypothetical protein